MTGKVHNAVTRLKRDGLPSFTKQVIRKAAGGALRKFAWDEPGLPLRPEDIVDLARWRQPAAPTPILGPLRIGWVCTPPGAGSGGHTTFFRMVGEMEEHGHQCTLFLYDLNDDDVSRHEETIRRCWPGLNSTIRSATDGLAGMDALVASSWGTAHVIAARAPRAVHRFYFVQDYEPYFYPRGALYTLAEDSYRLGFTSVALGGMIGPVMKSELGQEPAATVPFGCDTSTYHLLRTAGHQPARSGVVFYAKKHVDRRGYVLAKMALEAFHELCPDQEIHAFGDRVTGWDIPITNHGNLPPQQLNKLYNRTIAGLAFSFTNVSLIPGELMAAGNVPVINESPFSSQVLDDPDVRWVSHSPNRIAGALAEVVRAPDISDRAGRIAGRARTDWTTSQKVFASIVESTCAGKEDQWP